MQAVVNVSSAHNAVAQIAIIRLKWRVLALTA